MSADDEEDYIIRQVPILEPSARDWLLREQYGPHFTVRYMTRAQIEEIYLGALGRKKAK